MRGLTCSGHTGLPLATPWDKSGSLVNNCILCKIMKLSFCLRQLQLKALEKALVDICNLLELFINN